MALPSQRLLWLLAALGAALTPAAAWADQPWHPGDEVGGAVRPRVKPPSDMDDGVYGRFDGDLDLGLGLGVHHTGESAPAVSAGVHYLSTIGIIAQYADRLGLDSDDEERSFGLAGELRPLFLPRWALDWERGPAWWDLTVDSLSIAVGHYWKAPPGGALGDHRGLEASAGLGVPLSGDANGFWLRGRGILRWRGGDADSSVLLLVSWQRLTVSPWIAD